MPKALTPYPIEDTCQKFLLSVDDYLRMGEAGIFENKPRGELINGEILVRSPLSSYHSGNVDKISEFFTQHLSGKAKIRPQGAIRLDNYSEPEPDIAILKFRDDYYKHAHPSSKDVYLLVEVSIETLKKDRTIKLKKYAESNIPEYWIVIPKEEKVEVYRKPVEGAYLEKEVYGKEDQWKFEAFDLEIKGRDMLV